MKSRGVFSFLIILKESINLLPKNGKLMVLIAILYILISSSIQALFTYSIVSLADNLLPYQKSLIPNQGTTFNASDPTSFTPDLTQMTDQQLDQMKRITAIIFAVEIATILANLIIFNFTTVATVLVSAVSYNDKTLLLKDLFSRIGKTWTKPLITTFYVSIQWFGLLFAFGMLALPALMYQNMVTISFAIIAGILLLVVVFYFYVVWVLAVVISVLEEDCHGMKAMRKASKLVSGQRLNGYMLNIFFVLFGSIIFLGFSIILRKNTSILSGIFVGMFSRLVMILQMVAYTVWYFHCKKQRGEEIEFQGGFQYAILPTTQG